MPHSELHQKKRRKNLMVGAALLAWVALMWVVTFIKMT